MTIEQKEELRQLIKKLGEEVAPESIENLVVFILDYNDKTNPNCPKCGHPCERCSK